MNAQLAKIKLEPKAEMAFEDLRRSLEDSLHKACILVADSAKRVTNLPKEIRLAKIDSLDSLQKELYEMANRLEEIEIALWDNNIEIEEQA